ncbi:hypothetical protein FI667_g1525, partial [Globisporangium splendens]
MRRDGVYSNYINLSVDTAAAVDNLDPCERATAHLDRYERPEGKLWIMARQARGCVTQRGGAVKANRRWSLTQGCDDLKFYCVDRAKNEPYSALPLRENIAECSGFIGKVCVPLARLPEGEEVEQWYPLVPKETSLSLRTALRVALCFNPSGKTRGRGDSFSMQLRRVPAQLSMTAATEITSASPVGPSRLRVQIPPSPIQSSVSIALKTGVVDYFIVVGPSDGCGSSECQENSLLLRYPAIDRSHFPLPTKIEWFCFPGGPEVVIQADRPQSKLFSFVLVGGDDGLCRSYVVCLTVYHRPKSSSPSKRRENEWHATCVSFLTRVPLIEELKGCLLGVAHAWLSAQASGGGVEKFAAEECIADLCNRVLIPIRGVFGVRFSIQQLPISLVLPAYVSIYSNHSRPSSTKHPSQPGKFSPTKSPSTNFVNIQQGFQPLVYSLAPIFQLFDVKTIIHLVSLVLCEYRILIHSTQFSLLCPFAEGLCALIYPFRWQHPYVPILPRVLSEYLQAPLPYILGVHTSWLPELLENGRPEHLVIVDIDRGTIQLQESTGPMLPSKLTKGLHQRIRKIIHPQLFDDIGGDDMIAVQESEIPADVSTHDVVKWDSQIEQQVRVEFVCFLAAMLMGYRDCLFFVNQKLPVFNKRRYFSTCANDNEVVPFVSKLFCTQAFQGFLENHSSAELSVFHSIYLTFSRGKDMEWPSSMPPMPISSHAAASSTDSAALGQGVRARSGVITPVYTMPPAKGSQNCVIAPNSQDAMEESEVLNTPKEDNVASIGEKVEALLDKLSSSMTDPFALNPAELESYSTRSPNHVCDYKQVAEDIGVDPRILEDNSDLFQNPHQVNQNQDMHGASTSHNGMVGGSNVRNLSTEEERIEQVLHKCLTSVFASDDMITPEDIRYVEMNSASTNGVASAGGSTWYNPKGSGNCIGESGFQILSRLSSTLMDQCAIHEDFTNARGMLQVAFQYYHFIEDKHSGVGFAKKEYLVTPLRLRPICRSLDMWQHAFSREIDAAIQADPTISDESNPNSVADEVFFSIIGSLVYDMLTMEVPLPKVHTFVSVMCSTYQKGRDLLDTLKQLVENVHRALEMSKDVIKAPAEKVPVAVLPVTGVPVSSEASVPMVGKDSPAISRQYDLDTVIRRKMSTNDVQFVPLRSPSSRSFGARANNTVRADIADSSMSSYRRRAASASFPSVVLSSQSTPILSMAIYQGRVACGQADSNISVVETSYPDKRVKLDGHTDSVVAVQLRGNTLISGSRDHTLRAWDLHATPKKRPLFSFFSHGSSQSANGEPTGEVDGASVSKKSQVWKGHTAPISCLEMGRQLSTDRSIICSGSDDGTIRLWDTTRANSVALLGNGKGAVSCLRFLALYDFLVSGCREYSLKVWDLSVSKLKTNIQAHRGSIRDIQITGDRLVTASDDRIVKVWDAHFRAGQSYVHALRDHGGPVQCVSLGGPADPNICTGSSDGIVRVWDLRYVDKGPRLTLSGHIGPVTCLQRDFTKLVSGSEDGSLRVWDMHSGVCIKEVKAHLSGVTCIALRDSFVYSGSWDGSLRLWDIDAANGSSR